MAEMGYEIAQSNAAWILDKYEERSMCMGESGLCSDAERHQRSHSLWWQASEQGNEHAALLIGDAYYYGRGTVRDYERAAEAYMHARSQSNAQAMFNLGYMHEHGLGLPCDLHLAKRYYDQALEIDSAAKLPVSLALTSLWIRMHYAESFLVDMIDALPTVYPKIEAWVEDVILEEGNATILTLFVCLLTVLYFRERQRRHVAALASGSDMPAYRHAFRYLTWIIIFLIAVLSKSQYLATVDIARGYLYKSLSCTLEFIVESDKADLLEKPVSPEMVMFHITQDTQQHVLLSELKSGGFRINGRLTSLCSLMDPISGELTVEMSAVPIRSIDIHLLSMESILVGEKIVTETSLVQTTQIADGDVCRNMTMPIHVILPRLLTCPTILAGPFSIEFKVSIVISFQSDLSTLHAKSDATAPRLWSAMETLPLELVRTK